MSAREPDWTRHDCQYLRQLDEDIARDRADHATAKRLADQLGTGLLVLIVAAYLALGLWFGGTPCWAWTCFP